MSNPRAGEDGSEEEGGGDDALARSERTRVPSSVWSVMTEGSSPGVFRKALTPSEVIIFVLNSHPTAICCHVSDTSGESVTGWRWLKEKEKVAERPGFNILC